MAYPDNILTLQTTKDGSPWVRMPAKVSVNTDGLSVSKDGSPWWASEVPSTKFNLYVGDVQVSRVYIGSTMVNAMYFGDIQL